LRSAEGTNTWSQIMGFLHHLISREYMCLLHVGFEKCQVKIGNSERFEPEALSRAILEKPHGVGERNGNRPSPLDGFLGNDLETH
jgi:hypothetical protein